MNARAVAELVEGRSVTLWPVGNSMVPLVRSRDQVVVRPVGTTQLRAGDVVLVRVRGRIMLHKVTALNGERVQIGNNRGHINGWTTRSKVYGLVVEVAGVPAPWLGDR